MGVKVKPGYKQTEVGVIPEDWGICEFQEVMTGFSSGQTPSRTRPEYYTGSIPWITSGELNYGIITDTFEKITFEALEKTNLKIIPKGTFLFAITGLEAEGTRGSCGITGIDAATNQSCMALYPKNGLLSTEYLFHFYIRQGDWLALKYCQGTKQQSYNGHIAKKLPIIFPPTLAEQSAIATALSDADAFIQSLERLIAKKRDIKQGAMQELLTGKKRLPGFSGEWEEKTISGVSSKLKAGGTPSRTVKEFWRGTIPFVLIEDITSSNKYLLKTEEYITYIGLENSSTWIVPKDSILLSMYASLGELAINRIEVATNQAIIAIIPKESYDLDFLYYNLKFNKLLFEKLVSQTTQKNLNKEKVSNFEIKFPIKKQEQTAIATVLSDMDAEIAALELKLAKARQIKQGMMQELLTGRIRLVCENQ